MKNYAGINYNYRDTSPLENAKEVSIWSCYPFDGDNIFAVDLPESYLTFKDSMTNIHAYVYSTKNKKMEWRHVRFRRWN